MEANAVAHRPRPWLHAVVAVIAVALALPASAAQRTFVHSGPLGNDSNTASNCTQAQPCRTFGGAITVTDAGGEIVILDTAGYGAVTITKPIKIIGAGVYAGISVFSGDGITVNAGPGDIVVLRGLTLNSLGGSNGVHVQSASRVDVEDAKISGFPGAGILVDDAAAPNQVSLVNVTFRNGGDGVRILADTHYRRFDSDNLIVTDASSGVVVQGNVDAAVRNSSFEYLGAGVRVTTNAPNQHPSVTIERNRMQNNGSGVLIQNTAAFSSSEVTLVDSVIAGSQYHVQMIESGGGFAKLDVARSTFERAARAIDASTTGSGVTNVMIADSMISATFERAVSVDIGAGGYGQLTMTRNAMRNAQNGTQDAIAVYLHAGAVGHADGALQGNILTNSNQGFVADSNSFMRLNGNTIVNTGPGAGLMIQGTGGMESLNNNMVRGSASADATPVIVPPK